MSRSLRSRAGLRGRVAGVINSSPSGGVERGCCLDSAGQIAYPVSMQFTQETPEHRPLTPRIASDFWKICEMPDLEDLTAENPADQDIVDHHFYLAPDGQWRLWAAIRGTAVGHPIHAWKGDSLRQTGWDPLGVQLRANRDFGEREAEDGHGLVCAPFFVQHEGVWNCFYNSEGIHRLKSEDGIHFDRVLDAEGRSLSHVGGRDPMIAFFDGFYYAYSSVTRCSQDNWLDCFIIVRTSPDLESWSDYTVVSSGGIAGNGAVSAESPFVIRKAGYYYLFRSSSITFKTYVYRSETPYHFGINEDQKLVTILDLKAPEIISSEGKEYISHLGDFSGIQLAELEWK